MSKELNTLISIITNNSNLKKLGAEGGTRYCGGTDPHTLEATSLVAREDTVVSAMTGTDANNAAVNFVTQFNISGVTLVQGDLLIAPAGHRIKSLTLTSGSVLVYS